MHVIRSYVSIWGSVLISFDRMYWETHHKNGDKLNNNDSNLECLCISCHADVDDCHRANFSKGANLAKLNSFKQKYL